MRLTQLNENSYYTLIFFCFLSSHGKVLQHPVWQFRICWCRWIWGDNSASTRLTKGNFSPTVIPLYTMIYCIHKVRDHWLHVYHAYQLFLTLMWEVHVSDVGVEGSMWETFFVATKCWYTVYVVLKIFYILYSKIAFYKNLYLVFTFGQNNDVYYIF